MARFDGYIFATNVYEEAFFFAFSLFFLTRARGNKMYKKYTKNKKER